MEMSNRCLQIWSPGEMSGLETALSESSGYKRHIEPCYWAKQVGTER